MDVDKIRKDFPIFSKKLRGKEIIYFDNAATTHRPKQVIEAMDKFYMEHNANVHRAVHTLSYEATELFEAARKRIAKFIGARSWKEIIWLRGATEGINLLAHSLCLHSLNEGDEIIISLMEHHSNMVPWQRMAKLKKLKLKYIKLNEEKRIDLDDLRNKITERTRIISVTHASNVLGVINPVKEIKKIAEDAKALLIVDGAQSIPHLPVNVQELGCDFLVASGHKMLGPTGIGFLYGREEVLENMEPFMSGGDMIETVTLEGASWNKLPWKFEAGTPNIAGAIGLASAADYLEGLRMDEVLLHEKELKNYCMERLREIKGVKIYTPEGDDVLGIISFNIKGIHPHDVAGYLDEEGIEVRSGHHCAQPLMSALGMENAVRVSFYIYNTREEIDKFILSLEKLRKIFKLT